MVQHYQYEFNNTPENVKKVLGVLEQIAFHFPEESESFFKLQTEPLYETYVSVSCNTPINQGKRLVKIQTSLPSELFGAQEFDSRLKTILHSVDAKEIKQR
jgi:hypothetical protein